MRRFLGFSGADCTSAFKGKGEGRAPVGPLSRAEAVGRVHLPDVRTELRVFGGRRHRVALYKCANESILEKSKPYDDG